MTALFALDQNFPEPIVEALNDYVVEAELVPVRDVDPLLAEVDDWEIFVSLLQHDREWDGLITTDSGMLTQPRTRRGESDESHADRGDDSGHDPIKATGLLFTHLGYICRQTRRDQAQVWELRARNRPAHEPWHFFTQIANHTNRTADDVWNEGRLSAADLARDPLA